jgi:hypothetical protein
LNHRIQIHASAEPGRYNVTGDCRVDYTDAPLQDAARALKANGADDRDMIHVVCAEVNFLPASIHSILKPRRPPLRSDIERQSNSYR